MMVCGSIVSSEALAGAVSGSKAVPVTTTVSISPALEAFAANCWALALPAKTAKRAQVAECRKNSDFIKITPGNSSHAGPSDCACAIAVLRKHICADESDWPRFRDRNRTDA